MMMFMGHDVNELPDHIRKLITEEKWQEAFKAILALEPVLRSRKDLLLEMG